MFFILGCWFLVVRRCFSKFVIKDGVKERKLYFYYRRGLLTLKFKCISARNVVRSLKQIFQKLLMIIVTFTHEFKEKCMELAGLFFGSIRKIAYKVRKDTGISIFQTKQYEKLDTRIWKSPKKERIVIVDITSLTWEWIKIKLCLELPVHVIRQ